MSAIPGTSINGRSHPHPLPFTVEQFRARFTAFRDPAEYPDATIESWLQLATCMVGAASWGCLYELGVMLWAAHELAKMKMAEQAGVAEPSGIMGIVQSKGVGPVSVAYNTQIGMEDGAGQYNLTVYGRQYWAYAKLIGMGPYQIGPAVSGGPLAGNVGAGWMGPVFGVWPNWELIG